MRFDEVYHEDLYAAEEAVAANDEAEEAPAEEEEQGRVAVESRRMRSRLVLLHWEAVVRQRGVAVEMSVCCDVRIKTYLVELVDEDLGIHETTREERRGKSAEPEAGWSHIEDLIWTLELPRQEQTMKNMRCQYLEAEERIGVVRKGSVEVDMSRVQTLNVLVAKKSVYGADENLLRETLHEI